MIAYHDRHSDIYLTDFRRLTDQVKPSSVNVMPVDPPWPREYLPLYADAAMMAARVLAPGGVMLVYGGDYLDEIIEQIRPSGLMFWKDLSIFNGAYSAPLKWSRRCFEGHRTVLMYTKGRYTGTIHATAKTTGRRKEHHPWQQALEPLLLWLHDVTKGKPDQLVLSPFLGSGTDGIAAKMLGLSFVGCEIDPITYEKAVKRITETRVDRAEAIRLAGLAIPRKPVPQEEPRPFFTERA